MTKPMTTGALLLITLFGITCCQTLVRDESSIRSFISAEQQLSQRLYKHCNINARFRPAMRYGTAVDIAISLNAMKFKKIDDQEQTFTILTYIGLSWRHPCTRWENITELADTLAVEESFENTWTPPLLHVNGEEEVSLQILGRDTRIRFGKDGRVLWSFTTLVTSSCLLNFDKFPFDVQVCELEIESWYPTTAISMHIRNTKVQDNFINPNGAWNLIGFNSSLEKMAYDQTSSREWDRAVFTFTFQRRHEAYVTSIFLPSFSLVALQILSSVLPPHEPDRSNFCITLVLANAVLQSTILDLLPPTSKTPYIVIFLASQLVSGLMCCVYALVTCELARKPPFQVKIAAMKGIVLIRLIDVVFYTCVALVITAVNLAMFIQMLA